MAQDAQIDGNLITDDRPLAVEHQGVMSVLPTDVANTFTYVQAMLLVATLGQMLDELKKIRVHLETITDQDIRETDI